MIAVTGANGLLGSFIIRKLIEKKEPFVAIKRNNSDISLLQDAGPVEWRSADVLDPVSVEDALKDVTSVIHAAAVVSFNPSHEKKIFKVNVTGTRNLVNAAIARNVERFVHVSSVAALGRQKGQTQITEDNKWLESAANSIYAESKYLAELEVFRACEEGLPAVIVNPSVILAPADWNKSSSQLFKYVWEEKRFYIDSDLNYVDVRDVTDAVYRLWKSDITCERFIVNGGSIPFLDFFIMVADRLNKRPPDIKLGKATLKIGARLETIRAKIMGREPLLTAETARLAGTHFNYSSEKIRDHLKMNFQTIDSTLAWCCSYYLNYIDKK